MEAAIITGIVAIIVCLANNIVTIWQVNKRHASQIAEQRKSHEETIELITYRLRELERKQDKHNNLMERVFKLEGKIDCMSALTTEKIKVANHRIKDLEQSDN